MPKNLESIEGKEETNTKKYTNAELRSMYLQSANDADSPEVSRYYRELAVALPMDDNDREQIGKAEAEYNVQMQALIDKETK